MNQNDASSSSSPISKKVTYRKRKKTLKKKAEELSILCGIPVGLVCIEPDGKVETWPENRGKVAEIVKLYLEKTNKSADVKRGEEVNDKKRKSRYETWSSDLDYLSEEDLIEILEYVKKKEEALEERIRRERNRGTCNGISDDSKTSSLSSDSENTE